MSNKSDWLDMVEIESLELDSRIEKLTAFLNNGSLSTL